jgi:hypothetical protein
MKGTCVVQSARSGLPPPTKNDSGRIAFHPRRRPVSLRRDFPNRIVWLPSMDSSHDSRLGDFESD